MPLAFFDGDTGECGGSAVRRNAQREADECRSNSTGETSPRISIDDERVLKLTAEWMAPNDATQTGTATVLQTMQDEGILKKRKVGWTSGTYSFDGICGAPLAR